MLATERVFRHNALVGTMVGVAIVGDLVDAAVSLGAWLVAHWGKSSF
jgi:hypothetical protein